MVEGIKDIVHRLGKTLADLVDIQRATDCFYIKTKEFLHGAKGKEQWIELNTIFKELGGEWKSMGKDSHWEIPFETTEKEVSLDVHARMQKALEHIREAGKLLSEGLK